MDTQTDMVRVHPDFNRSRLVTVLMSVVINTFRRLDQKPNQIQHKRTYKVENSLICKVAGNYTGVIKNYIANRILYAVYKRHNSVFNFTQNM